MKDCTTCKHYIFNSNNQSGLLGIRFYCNFGRNLTAMLTPMNNCENYKGYDEKTESKEENPKPIEEKTAIDYESVRIKAAIAAMREWIRISDKIPYNGVPQTEKSKEIAKLAVNCANDLVEELKNNNANK